MGDGEDVREELSNLRRKKSHWELLRKLNSAPAADAALEALIDDCERRIRRLSAQADAEAGKGSVPAGNDGAGHAS